MSCSLKIEIPFFKNKKKTADKRDTDMNTHVCVILIRTILRIFLLKFRCFVRFM